MGVKSNFDAKSLHKKIMKVAGNAIEQRSQSVRCPVHGKPAKIERHGTEAKPEWKVLGCCKEFVQKVKASLKK
jgi:hypothetical protein